YEDSAWLVVTREPPASGSCPCPAGVWHPRGKAQASSDTEPVAHPAEVPMEASQREEFRRFVTERTPELFEVAYAIAGRQDGAERLLQSALERLALRWGRTTDPYGYVVRLLRRRSLPWWRRWTATGEPPPPPTAGRGRLVDLGDLALLGARRRRLVRA